MSDLLEIVSKILGVNQADTVEIILDTVSNTVFADNGVIASRAEILFAILIERADALHLTDPNAIEQQRLVSILLLVSVLLFLVHEL